MKSPVCAALTAVILTATAAAASADPIAVIQDLRFADVQALGHFAIESASDALSATAFGTTRTSTMASTATLTSSFTDPLHWFGLGTGDLFLTTQDHGDG